MTAQTALIGITITTVALVGIGWGFLRTEFSKTQEEVFPPLENTKKTTSKRRKKRSSKAKPDSFYLKRIEQLISQHGRVTRTQIFFLCGVRKEKLNRLINNNPHRIRLAVVVSKNTTREFIEFSK